MTDMPAETRKFLKRPPSWRIADIVDGRNLRVQLTAAHMESASDSRAARAQVMDVLHRALFRGRMIAQERLEAGADGLDTARLMSAVMDEVLGALFDYTCVHVFRARNPTEGERMAVLAVGGYGRGALAPSSDVDLLFVRTYKQTAWAESVIEHMLYMLWDLGLKVGHAFRTVDECIKLADQDVTIRTAILDRRFLFGDEKISNLLDERFASDVVKHGGPDFIRAKLAERDRRIDREGNSRYRVEPNIKDGKGGLRDLQTLFWLARFLHGGANFEGVLQNEAFTEREAAIFRREARFLWTVRCHLHFLTGRCEDRLTFDVQPEMAARMGYVGKNGLTSVERFMKRYFLAAKEVGALTRILCARLEAMQKKQPTGLLRFLPTPDPKPLPDDRFMLDAGRVTMRSREVFLEDPCNLFRLFLSADEVGRDVHPDAMQTVKDLTRRLVTPEFRDDATARGLFLDLATSKQHPGTSLKLMNEVGLLGRFLPEFGHIVGQTQFNMYHHYTVDEHTLMAVSVMNEIERGNHQEEHPLATEIFSKIENRRALYLAMLLHDTGKGQGDQQIEGARNASEACRNLGLGEEESELVAWLVGHHLDMSDTAQRRDISDPKTVSEFANLVGDLEHLRLLLVLTICDIRAVGPDVWNAWKGQLLRELYHATAAALSERKIDENSIRSQLSKRADVNREAVAAHAAIPTKLRELEKSYWTTFDLETHLWHMRALQDQSKDVIAAARVVVDQGTTEVVVQTQDRRRLFVDLCAVMTACGANIVAARLFAGQDGLVVDVFELQDGSGGPYCEVTPYKLDELTEALEQAGRGEIDHDAMAPPALNASRRQAAFIVLPDVSIDRSYASDQILIELTGRDRPGLMHDIAQCFLKHDLSIQSAHAESYGMRVHDTFYVAHMSSAELDEKTLKSDLVQVLEMEQPDAPRTPIGQLAQAVVSDDR